MEYHLSIKGEFLKLKIKTETFLGMGRWGENQRPWPGSGPRKQTGADHPEPQNLKVYAQVSRKQLLILGEGEDLGTEK